jgi:hypothetical protein
MGGSVVTVGRSLLEFVAPRLVPQALEPIEGRLRALPATGMSEKTARREDRAKRNVSIPAAPGHQAVVERGQQWPIGGRNAAAALVPGHLTRSEFQC